MSAAFTTLTAGENALSLAMANEIVLAYSERRQALGQSVVSALTAGTSAQDKTLWLAMQVWCEANCTSFVDHVNGPLNPASDDFLYFTLATWRAAAGLNASGYRRSTDGTTMLYGNIQTGDVRGKWTFEDLQKGFGILIWTARIPASTDCRAKGGGNAYPIYTYGGAVAEYDSNSWGSSSGVECATASAFRYWVPYEDDISNGVFRRQYKYVFYNLFPIPRTIELWMRGVIPTQGGMGWDATTQFKTFSGQGDLTSGLLQKVDEIAEDTSNPMIFDYLNAVAPPSAASPNALPDSCNAFGYDVAYVGGLLKWNFTNA